MRQQVGANPSKWESTEVQGLYRRQPSGIFYARGKVGGKTRWQSLDTDRFTEARQRHAVCVLKQGQMRKAVAGQPDHALTFERAIEEIVARMKADNPAARPNTTRYWDQNAARVIRHDPEHSRRRLSLIGTEQWRQWAQSLRVKFSGWSFNKALAIAKAALDLAMERGAIHENPIRAAKIKGRTPRLREVTLPSSQQFTELVRTVRTSGSGFAADCGDFIELGAYTGLRKSELGALRWSDVDVDRGRLTVRESKTEAGQRVVPLIPDAITLLREIGQGDPDEPVLGVRECQKALDRACGIVGCPRLTHHDLRRLFTTKAIEAGVDIPTVARWLGHADGGALLMRVYGRLRVEHSEEQAKRVRFNGQEGGAL